MLVGAARWTREKWRGIPPRERRLLLGAIVLGVALRVAFVVLTRRQALNGDEFEYDVEGRFIAAGHWFWSLAPYGIPHEATVKAPGYVAWVGIWYSILGDHHARVEVLQAAILGPLTIGLTWMLGRRLWTARVGLAGAFLAAVYPLAWQYETRLYSESIATPLTLLVLLLFLNRTPSVRRAAAVGVAIGVSLLLRPSSGFLLAGVAVTWVIGAGWIRGSALTMLSVAVAALVVAPWTYRNYRVTGGLIPISIQDAAAYGTFNDAAAHQVGYPYLWRAIDPRDADLFNPLHPLSDLRLRAALLQRTRAYIAEHPFSVLQAFFWNGLSRLWDVRRPSRALNEVFYEGRSRLITIIGLAMYYLLLPLALLSLWLNRARRALVAPLLAVALGASIVFTPDSGTRYRAPLEPMIVLLACAAVLRPRSGEVAMEGRPATG